MDFDTVDESARRSETRPWDAKSGGGGTRKSSPAGLSTILAILGLLYALALVLACVLLATGRVEVGAIGVLLVLTTAPIAFVLAAVQGTTTDRELLVRIEELVRVVRETGGQSALSDDARRLLNRDTEREILRNAIREEIDANNWDAALVFVHELADRFGFRRDAEEFRQMIREARASTMESQLNEAIGFLDTLITQRRWSEGLEEAGRIQRLFPDSPRVERLRERVMQAKSSYKDELERRLYLCSSSDDPQEAMALLRELDPYLTPEEAEPLRELARGVIGKARDNLGAKFKLAVKDRQWKDAVKLGEEITREFPNSRMAEEIREVLDVLRRRAAAD